MLPLLDILSPVISKLIDYIPDPAKKLEAQQKIQEELLAHEDAIMKSMQASDEAQGAVNLEEAKSFNLFIAGPRPFLIWICGFSFAWVYVLQPMITFWLAVFHKSVMLPTLDFAAMSPILTGMLGLAGMRTYEKQRGVQGNH